MAGALIPGADLTIENVGLNPTRTGILEVLEQMGARIEVLNPVSYTHLTLPTICSV